jgi:hypothetical protein
MNRFHGLGRYWGGTLGLRLGGVVVVLAVCLAIARPASAQVVPAATGGGFTVSAGATGSGFYLQYGERKMLGVSGFVDADTRRGIGVEAEGRWLEFHQTANVHAETYSIGPRYHMNFGKFQPYAKGLVGFGDFNFPYNYGHGSYLVISPGVGADYRINGRLHWRADFEYQLWPQFNYGATTSSSMTGLGVSTGIRVRIF